MMEVDKAFQIHSDMRHYESLDLILKKLRFFKTMNKQVRFALYKEAKYIKKKPG